MKKETNNSTVDLNKRIFDAIVKQGEKEIAYKEYRGITKARAIISNIYTDLEWILTSAIHYIFLGNNKDKKLVELFENQILIPLNISKKIELIKKTGKFDNKIINNIDKIRILRNALVHYSKKIPEYDKKNILHNENVLTIVKNDADNAMIHIANICSKLRQKTT